MSTLRCAKSLCHRVRRDPACLLAGNWMKRCCLSPGGNDCVLWSSSQAALSCNASRGPAPQLVCKFSMSYDLEDDGRQGLQEDDLLEDAEVDTLVREAIAQALGETHFKHEMVLNWTNGIIEGCLKKLAVLAKPFKYVVTCSLSQKVGAGLHSACTVRWNDKTDGNLSVQWENKTILVLATVYWLAV